MSACVCLQTPYLSFSCTLTSLRSERGHFQTTLHCSSPRTYNDVSISYIHPTSSPDHVFQPLLSPPLTGGGDSTVSCLARRQHWNTTESLYTTLDGRDLAFTNSTSLLPNFAEVSESSFDRKWSFFVSSLVITFFLVLTSPHFFVVIDSCQPSQPVS